MTLRDEIKKYLENNIEYHRNLELNRDTDSILALIEPKLAKARILNDKIGHLVGTDIAVLVEKARQWDKVVEMSKSRKFLCDGCKYYATCNAQFPLCDGARDIMLAIYKIDALSGKEEG